MPLRLATLPLRLLPLLGIGAVLALGGGLWDDAWHTERGRDSFFIAPHLAVYGGVTIVGSGIGLWLLFEARRTGWHRALQTPQIALAAVSVVVTLASAPVDNFWHSAFGRDAVIWSPPHVLGIVGTGSLVIAILVDLTASPTAWSRRMRGPLSGLLLAAFAFLVVEYETDVPQFSARWYLPVLALAAGFVFAIVATLRTARWPATVAAAWQLCFIAVISALLRADSFGAPRLPLLIVPALVFDVARRRGTSLWLNSALCSAVLFAVYGPAAHIGHGAQLDGSDVLVGLPLGWLGFALPQLLLRDRPRRAPHRAAMVTSVVAGLLVLPAGALAHDPGQGPSAGSMSLSVRVHAGRATVDAVPRPRAALAPVAIVARRGGSVHRGALRSSGDGRFTGAVALHGSGRWFVYVDLRRANGQLVESWLPVESPESAAVHAPARFAYVVDRKSSSALKWLIGALLYAAVVAYLVAVVQLVKRSRRREMSYTS